MILPRIESTLHTPLIWAPLGYEDAPLLQYIFNITKKNFVYVALQKGT
jgi:hypothetical protein